MPDITGLLKQINNLYHGGQPPFNLVYDQLIADGHKIEIAEKNQMWNLAQHNSKSQEEAVILYKSYLVKKYLMDKLNTDGKLFVYDAEDKNKTPIVL